MDISKIYTKWAVENVQCGISRLLEAEKYSKNKSGNCFAGHGHPLFQKVSYVSFWASFSYELFSHKKRVVCVGGGMLITMINSQECWRKWRKCCVGYNAWIMSLKITPTCCKNVVAVQCKASKATCLYTCTVYTCYTASEPGGTGCTTAQPCHAHTQQFRGGFHTVQLCFNQTSQTRGTQGEILIIGWYYLDYFLLYLVHKIIFMVRIYDFYGTMI